MNATECKEKRRLGLTGSSTIPWRIRMYGILMATFTINKNPSHVNASIYHTYGSVMGMYCPLFNSSGNRGPRRPGSIILWGFPARKVEVPKAGWFVSWKIPVQNLDENVWASPHFSSWTPPYRHGFFLAGNAETHHYDLIDFERTISWLVVGPPLWKIWKSIGMIGNPILMGK